MELFRVGMRAALGLLPALGSADVLGTRETEGLKLGIRYAYDARHHHRAEPPEKRGERLLHLDIEGQSVTEVPVPDSGGWNRRWTGFASEGPVGPLCPTNIPLPL